MRGDGLTVIRMEDGSTRVRASDVEQLIWTDAQRPWRADRCTIVAMPAVGYELWFFPESLDFGESTSTGFVAALPPETVIFKAAYVPVGVGIRSVLLAQRAV